MKERLLVMNGSRIVQAEESGGWVNKKVDRAGELKPGIYNIYNARKAMAGVEYAGAIVHADKDSVYQQTAKAEFVRHQADNFERTPKIGDIKTIVYSQAGAMRIMDTKESLKLAKVKAI